MIPPGATGGGGERASKEAARVCARPLSGILADAVVCGAWAWAAGRTCPPGKRREGEARPGPCVASASRPRSSRKTPRDADRKKRARIRSEEFPLRRLLLSADTCTAAQSLPVLLKPGTLLQALNLPPPSLPVPLPPPAFFPLSTDRRENWPDRMPLNEAAMKFAGRLATCAAGRGQGGTGGAGGWGGDGATVTSSCDGRVWEPVVGNRRAEGSSFMEIIRRWGGKGGESGTR